MVLSLIQGLTIPGAFGSIVAIRQCFVVLTISQTQAMKGICYRNSPVSREWLGQKKRPLQEPSPDPGSDTPKLNSEQ